MEDENIPRADKPFYNNVQRKAKATPYAIQLERLNGHSQLSKIHRSDAQILAGQTGGDRLTPTRFLWVPGKQANHQIHGGRKHWNQHVPAASAMDWHQMRGVSQIAAP